MPFKKVYAVAGGIGEIGDVAESDGLRLVSSHVSNEATTGGECSLKGLVKVADDEVEVDRRPMTAIVTGDRALRPNGEPVNPEGLSG